MKSFIKYIGVITKDRKIHSVEFTEGVNVITGKSSTGKSAILEVFDYCFGSSEFIIPDGEITDRSMFYFTILKKEEEYLILGRGSNPKECYLSISTDFNLINNVENFNYEYFQGLDQYALRDFKKELNKHFRISIEDTDIDLEDRNKRYNKAKKAAPSYRHFTSFILQHQNLIANKHALFYRFDEKEKKDQVIDQFKIFSSFVDAEYFPLKQRLAEYRRELKQLGFTKDNIINHQKDNIEKLNFLIEEYELITNERIFKEDVESVLLKPSYSLDYLDKVLNNPDEKIITNDFSINNIEKRSSLQRSYNKKIANIRKIQNIISEIDVSIIYAKDFENQSSNISHINNVNIETNECKFCGNENVKLLDKQKKLQDAIHWFNSEMDKSHYTISSFVSNKKEYEIKISELSKEASKDRAEIKALDKIISSLEKNKSIEYQATKVIIKIEAFLEALKENNLSIIEVEINKKEEDIKRIEERLTNEYNVDAKLNAAERQINQQMNVIGKKLEFESIYKDNLNLKFDLKTFELYQQAKRHGKPDKKIYLRSMGSGANWLSSHVSLFTSLLYYSCSLKEKSLIPTILFLDQPSQVYFPTAIDNDDEFDGKELKKKLNEEKEYEDDINAVTNLFDQLVKFCDDTLDETGIKPQIIITDHADKLKLKNADFDNDLVRKRWRGKNDGFIKL
tara:strand:+ start:6297 stop:8336 length:2040 start_codon:yes stop_codon:yes gene_type:complete